MRRVMAIVLCVAMVLSWAEVPVSAEENGLVTVEETEAAVAETEATVPEETETVPAETETIPEETETTPTEAVWELPECDCGSTASKIGDHGDACTRKAFLRSFSDESAAVIYSRWNELPEDCRVYILDYLSWNSGNQTKLEELNALINGSEEPDTTGAASATTEDGTAVHVTGIPEGSQVSVNTVTDETALAALEAAAAAREDSFTQLFVWDIALQNAEGVETQPDGAVRVEMQIPGVTLHKYAEVFVLHVDDEGNVETLPAVVTENGGMAFETTGFSIFAGFTVDFEYNGEEFSINGYETILLSELFDVLKMPLYVSDVANVEFTNYELITVEEQTDGDWLLTSLMAFDTGELLKVTMNNGAVYEINVTDAAYPKVRIGSDGTWTATDGSIDWYADGDGNLENGWTSNYYWNYSDYWSQKKTIYVSGTGTLTITIHPAVYADASKTDAYKVNICQINVDGGANVKLVLSSDFDTNGHNCIIQNMDDRTMFQVYEGSLEVRGRQNGGKLIIDGHGASASKATENPIIRLNADAKKLIVTDAIFRDGKEGAIRSRANDLSEFTVKRCTFQKTIKRSGNGGAIYVFSNTADTKGAYVDIHDFEVSNCTFENNSATQYGGAMCLMGYIHKGLISNCTFTGCTSNQHGGAIDLSGCMGSMSIENSQFTDCSATYRGGAVTVRSTDIKNSSDAERWTRSNSVAFSGCTFTNCKSTGSHGGGIAVQAQLHTFKVSDCDFSGCVADVNGGAISIDGQDLPDTFKADGGPDWAAAISCSTCTDYGTAMTGRYDWKNISDSTKTVDNKSWINTVEITDGCTFTNCSATGELDSENEPSGGNGGAIEFAYGCYITNKATISEAAIDGCKALGEGSAIFWSKCFVKSMALTDSTIQNCTFTNDASKGPGGTVKVTGNTTIVLDVQKCNFLNNYSHQHGGGLYWNAARVQDGLECEATVNDCLFQGNKAALYGGGLYVESKMTITKCHIKENTAYMGGGIAQQVYNNPGARMLDEGGVTELKLDPNTWIHHNTANLGGGVSIRANETDSIEDGSPIAYTVRFELNGAAVYQNKAVKTSDGQDGHGGGIYFAAETSDDPDKQAEVDKYTKVILINEGTGTAAAVYNNTADGNGGGIYMDSSENTELRVQGGHISTNAASGDGGGIYMTGKNATCYVEGGVTGGEGNDSAGNPLANKASGNGGGIAISGGAAIEMTNGEISYNTASGNGGGVWLDKRGTDANAAANSIAISNGSIMNNRATTYGGGICMMDYSDAQLTGGSVDNNYAYRGAGVYAKESASITLTEGEIHHNTAGYLGGGIMANNAKVMVKGGSIYENLGPSSGGGIYAEYGATIDVTGGSIYKNTATKGWGAGIYAKNANTKVTVSGGDIYENSASGYGGGINVEGSAALEILGGSIYKNIAGESGGGIHSYESATITMKGGTISENTAGFAGGGIALRKGSTAQITNDGEKTAGTITRNTAARGGGVSVETGAELAVENGFITYNKAVGMPGLDTALNLNSTLKGTGGGVYVADGNSDTDPAVFKLTGAQIAIYGNLADFAADDVFANGKSTLLDIPEKGEMNLAGYEFNPEGWFEDYPVDDSAYESGLSLAAPDSGITNGNVYRYRESAPTERVLISDDVLKANVNVANKYVCMTLGIPAAVPDTVVIDFGLPVDIEVLLNEQMTIANASLVGIGAARAEKEGVDFSADLQLNGTSLELGFGKAEIISNGANNPEQGVIRYTPGSMEMKDADTFSYAVKYTNSKDVDGADQYYYYYANVKVIPATSIYYEDDFVSYSVWNVSDDSENTEKKWTDAGTAQDKDQAQDRPGKLTVNDANNIYGYDGAYTSMATYSMGSSKKVTVDSNVYAEAQFTFQGTGFDVVSLTSNLTGTILVDVYKTDDFKLESGDNYSAAKVESHMVDTYYGYQYVNGEWVVDENAKDTLYQVPVMKVSGLAYGNYTAVITAAYKKSLDHQNRGSYDFYLDAIRIYDPANDGKDNTTIKDAYTQDGEGWPEYFELRNLIISKNDFDNLDNETGSGIVFIDNTKDTNKNTTYTIADYTNYGPNNELYLAPGQAVAFNLYVGDPSDTCKVAGIHLAMKTVGGTASACVYDANDSNKTSVTPTTISTAADLYYNITALNGKTVIIKNDGTAGSILSITNVKVTYTDEHVDYIEESNFTVNQRSVKIALASLASAPEENVPEETVPDSTEPEAPETFEPEKLKVKLSSLSAKVGSRVIVTVTTGDDVESVIINGAAVTKYTTNRRTGERTWRVSIKAEAAGTMTVRVSASNADGLESQAVNRSVAVSARTATNSWIGNVLNGLMSHLLSKLR